MREAKKGENAEGNVCVCARFPIIFVISLSTREGRELKEEKYQEQKAVNERTRKKGKSVRKWEKC